MILLDGRKLAQSIQAEIAEEVTLIKQSHAITPHLAAVLVGDNPASQVYVQNKVKACQSVGIKSTLIRKDASTTEQELLDTIDELNADPNIHGYIVQLPLPASIDEQNILLAIDPSKDVDGFHPCNMGRIAMGIPAYIPATPFGILQILERYNIPTEGKQCVIVGRSNIVGTPLSILLSRKSSPGNATVTLAHSRTKNLAATVKQADILVAAIGIPNFITRDMVKPGAVVIDVGINRVEAPERKKGFKLVGDVDFDEVGPHTSHITPVPGGVGPMTVTSLLKNTLRAAKKEVYV